MKAREHVATITLGCPSCSGVSSGSFTPHESVQPQMLSDQPTMPASEADMSITPIQQIACSCTGALITSTCMTPLDVVKIRLQAQQKASSKSTNSRILMPARVIYSTSLIESFCLCSHCTDIPQNFAGPVNAAGQALRPNFGFGSSPLMKGFFDTFVGIVRTEGVGSLWSGLSPTLIMAIPATVIYFTTYDRIKYRLGYREGSFTSLHIPVLSGSLARVVAVTLVSPIELIRTKMQSTRLSYVEVCNAIRISINNNGVLFMMRGLGPSLFRDVPFSAIYWCGYETTKAYHHKITGLATPGFFATFLAGAFSGSVAAIVTLPFDVVKTHRQIELGEAVATGDRKLSSTWKLMTDLYKRNGWTALYAGIFPRVMKVAPSCAIMISIYEFGKSYFRDRNALRLSYSTFIENEFEG